MIPQSLLISGVRPMELSQQFETRHDYSHYPFKAIYVHVVTLSLGHLHVV